MLHCLQILILSFLSLVPPSIAFLNASAVMHHCLLLPLLLTQPSSSTFPDQTGSPLRGRFPFCWNPFFQSHSLRLSRTEALNPCMSQWCFPVTCAARCVSSVSACGSVWFRVSSSLSSSSLHPNPAVVNRSWQCCASPSLKRAAQQWCF